MNLCQRFDGRIDNWFDIRQFGYLVVHFRQFCFQHFDLMLRIGLDRFVIRRINITVQEQFTRFGQLVVQICDLLDILSAGIPTILCSIAIHIQYHRLKDLRRLSLPALYLLYTCFAFLPCFLCDFTVYLPCKPR
ncbi:hypothetical protein FXV77_17850 [Sphingobacterium phlebotomi]|uniref:Uncharacterized protein n=1 Tax=Sphingobacterium phlebotomi TaxID=2605433 RepID=A0A5D4H3C2_9SPHI|nr:hypothetical protein [Sphingobacterium phlebotomi]TYR33320.1 hypothetical protein FXV77_17850 [Sphingobacterium phlebotomi]